MFSASFFCGMRQSTVDTSPPPIPENALHQRLNFFIPSMQRMRGSDFVNGTVESTRRAQLELELHAPASIGPRRQNASTDADMAVGHSKDRGDDSSQKASLKRQLIKANLNAM